MSIPGLIDKNVQEIDGQYRSDEGLVAVEDIYRCGIQITGLLYELDLEELKRGHVSF